VVAKVREVIPSIPFEQFVGMVVAEWQTVQQFLKEGKTEGYALAGMKGGALITEAESAAELHARLHSLPFYPVLEIEIYPLLSVDEALAHAKVWTEATRARLAQGSH
jgi:hypothetical protein